MPSEAGSGGGKRLPPDPLLRGLRRLPPVALLRAGARPYAVARGWFEKSATQGHADAQYALGLMCDLGQGLGQDLAQARQWYEKAAAQGHVDALVCLGVLYESGRGVPQDAKAARRWYERAAELGSEVARKGLERLKARRT